MNLYWRSVIEFHLLLIEEIVKIKKTPSWMVVDKTSLCSDLVEIFLLEYPSGSKPLTCLPSSF